MCVCVREREEERERKREREKERKREREKERKREREKRLNEMTNIEKEHAHDENNIIYHENYTNNKRNKMNARIQNSTMAIVMSRK